MATQRSERTKYSFYEVTAFGEAVPGAQAFKLLRVVSDTLKQNKKTVESNALDASRQVKDIYKVAEDAAGAITAELAHGEFDWAFEGVLGGDFVPISLVGSASDISATSSDSSLNSAAGAFDNIVAGQFCLVKATVYTGYNGLWFVVSKTGDTKIVLSRGPTTISADKSGAEMGTVTIKQNYLRAGNTLKAYTLEKTYSDAAVFDLFNSLVVDSISLSLKGEELVPLTINFMGKSADQDNTATAAGSEVAEETTIPFNSTNNVFKLIEGSTVLSDELVSFDLTIKANSRARTAVSNTTPTGFAQDTVEADGKADFYFEDNARRTKVQNHTATGFVVALADAAGNYLVFQLERVHLLDLNSGVSGKKSDVLEQYSYKASKGQTYLQTVAIDSITAIA